MQHTAPESPIDLEHVRRARRVLDLLVLRFGVAHFMGEQPGSRGEPVRRRREARVSIAACEDAVALAKNWIERRTGREVNEAELRMMRRDLKVLLAQRIREGAACVR